jgi:bifunctional UDP-N-acetylglucosamine pyrophosphorylase / glucosamine-1-phosphate N-acetyltransferase
VFEVTERSGDEPSGGRVALIVLAAGAGTRMKSAIPKPLHLVAGKPMLWQVLRAGRSADPVASVVVLSPHIANDQAWEAADFDVTVAIQDPPRGTADAVQSALRVTPNVEWLLILFADHPLLTAEAVRNLIAKARESRALISILTGEMDGESGYARIERDSAGRVRRVVERKDDEPTARTGSTEINSGMMAVNARWARDNLPNIEASPVTGEYYLPELVRLAVDGASEDRSWPVETVAGEADALLGVNDRVELAAADARLRDRIRRRHMLAGVTMVLPETISIDDDVEIGTDTTILPYTVIERGTTIGARCRIGPHAVLSGASIGDDVVIRTSTIVDSEMAAGSDAGPYAHLRGGASIGPAAHIGNYAEVKNSRISERVRIGHVSYVGDATVGADTNIGAGTITCNYDGKDKHRTTIGENVFVGSDTMLVAPVELGDGAITGAGSVVTKDVPSGVTVVGVPARRIRSGRTAEVDLASGESSRGNKG